MTDPPAKRIRLAVEQWGELALISQCADILRGGGADPDLLVHLGGSHARAILAGTKADPWPRVWAARAMLYAWDDSASTAVVAGLAHEAWRVREMCAKVVALREVGAAAETLAELTDDPVPRVRAACVRALGAVGESEHADAVRSLTDDPDAAVRRCAERALKKLATRLDREL